MADEWAPIDGPAARGVTGPPAAPSPSGFPPAPDAVPPYGGPPPRRTGRASVWLAGVLTATLVVAVGTIAAVALGPGDAGRTGDAASRREPRRAGPADPGDAVRAAARRLEAAGTFAFEGVSVSSDPGEPDPGLAGLTDRVEGAVVLPDRSRQRSTPEIGDTVDDLVVGDRMWSRSSPLPEQLGDRPWVEGSVGEGDLDARSVVGWLADSTGHRDGPPDARGRRVIRATVPRRDLPGQASDGTLGVALNDDGDPVQVTFRVTDADGWVLDLAYDLSALGRPVAIEPPGEDEIDRTPSVREEDLAAADELTPIGLPGPPPGWLLVAGFLDVPIPECDVLNIDYAGPSGASLHLDVTRPECALVPPGGRPLRAGGLSGTVTGDGRAAAGALRVGEMAVVFEATALPQPEAVLALLAPIDPHAQAVRVPAGPP